MEKRILFGPETLQHLDNIRAIMAQLPGTEEYLCFETPAFRVKKKLLLRLQPDGDTLAVRSPDRDWWIQHHPDIFFVTPHFYNYPTVLLSLNKISKYLLQSVLTDGWKSIAPKTLLKQYQADLSGN